MTRVWNVAFAAKPRPAPEASGSFSILFLLVIAAAQLSAPFIYALF